MTDWNVSNVSWTLVCTKEIIESSRSLMRSGPPLAHLEPSVVKSQMKRVPDKDKLWIKRRVFVIFVHWEERYPTVRRFKRTISLVSQLLGTAPTIHSFHICKVIQEEIMAWRAVPLGQQAPISNWLYSHSAAAGDPTEISVGGRATAQLAARVINAAEHSGRSPREFLTGAGKTSLSSIHFMNKYSSSSRGAALLPWRSRPIAVFAGWLFLTSELLLKAMMILWLNHDQPLPSALTVQ